MLNQSEEDEVDSEDPDNLTSPEGASTASPES